MENRAHALIAGLFTLLLAIGATGAVWWFSGNNQDTRNIHLVTQRNVSGLNSQAQVRFRGIRAGKVDSITIDPKDPSTIVVAVSVDDWLPLTTATTAEIKMQGVTGLAFVELSDSGKDGKPLPDTRNPPPRITLRPSTFDLFGDEVSATLVQVKELAQRANALMNEDNIERIGGTLANIEDATGQAGKALKQLPEAVAAIRQFANPENAQRINRLIASLEKAGAQTEPMVKDARDLLATMQSASKRLDAVSGDLTGELTGNSLPRLNSLIHDLSTNSRQLTRVLNGIEDQPQQLIFGRPAGTPGPGEAGFGAAQPAR